MNIDEFIEHTKEKAREHRYHADFFESDNPMNTACIKSAEDCEWLADCLTKFKEYQQLEERLNKVYWDCDGLLLRVVEMLEKHPCVDMANNTLKSRLLTDEDVDKWEEYKQLEEQGGLLKFPCRVGDMLYYPDKEFNIIIPVRLTEIVIKFNGLDTSSCQYDCSSFDECGDVYEEYEFDTNDFGKSVFLTKSAAEAKLKELRGRESDGN